MRVYTIGHSTHSEDVFLKMLQTSGIEWIADVRAFPMSRKHPQFSKETFSQWLGNSGIGYIHLPRLGGRRSTSTEVGPSLNSGWRNSSFHNYADYALTDEFSQGIQELTELAQGNKLAYLCSERHPSRCHRLLISNWFSLHEWEVVHLIDNSSGGVEEVPHEPGKWGAMPILEDNGQIVYPPLG